MEHHDLLMAGTSFDFETLLRFVQTVIAVWLGSHFAHKTSNGGG